MDGFDLAYEPATGDWAVMARGRGAERLLLVGVPAREVDGAEVRTDDKPPPWDLHAGCYFFPKGAGVAGLIVGTGTTATSWRGRLDRTEDDHVVVQAAGWFGYLWDRAAPVGPRARFGVGSVVRIAGTDDIGTVIAGPTFAAGVAQYQVRVGSQPKMFGEASLLAVDTTSNDPLTWAAEPPAGAAEVSLLLSRTKMLGGFSDTVYSIGASKTVFRSYQFTPVLRMIESPRKRLLIADEVGLGKTIEAGLVWSELESRMPLARVLVVCPSVLVSKWRNEMELKFGRTLRALDKGGFDELISLYQRGDHTTRFHAVVSLQRLRATEQLERLEKAGPTFDLVIIDEAHDLRNPATSSHEVGALLSDWADAMVLLSATPLNLKQRDLHTLVNLLAPADFPDWYSFPEQMAPNAHLLAAGRELMRATGGADAALTELAKVGSERFGRAITSRPEFGRLQELLRSAPLSASDLANAKRLIASLHTLSAIVSRTRKVDVPGDKAVREARTIDVQWSPLEQEFYLGVRAWATTRAEEKGAPTGFATQMPLRQAASCIPAMIERLLAKDLAFEEDLVDLPIGADWSDGDDEAVSSAELRFELLELARDIDHDSKFDAFLAALREARAIGVRQVMVFSFFKRTLAYLAERLSDEWRVAVMHGDVPLEVRERIMQDFRRGHVDVLLLSEVGSEGLDFEFCNALVNYDLPWNPMRVEQRIGRIDRFGQESPKIFVFNFRVPGTIETDIFSRLYDRIGVFEHSIGELEPILRDEFEDLQRVALDPELSPSQRELRLKQIEVAFEARTKELDMLKASEGQMLGADGYLIDGLERDMDRGRFIGGAELRSIVAALVRPLSGCSMVVDEETEVATLRGTSELAAVMHRQGRSGSSAHSLHHLAQLLSDGEPYECAFDAEVAKSRGVELITSTHPLVRAGLSTLADSPTLAVGRFGRVGVASAPKGLWLVLVHVLEMTGVRPVKRLWPVTVDARTGGLADDAGFELLAALARGDVRTTRAAVPDDIHTLITRAQTFANAELAALDHAHRTENDQLLAARTAAVEAEFAAKRDRTLGILAQVTGTIRRVHEGHLARLEVDRDAALAALTAQRAVSVAAHPVAAVLVRGGAS